MRWALVCLFAWSASLSALAQTPPPPKPPAVEDYGKLPAIDMVALSPSGDRLAYVAVHQERRKLFVQTIAGQALIVSELGELKVREIEWAGEDHLLVSASQTARIFFGAPKQEFMQVVQVNVASKEIFPVFKRSKGIFPAVFGYAGSAKVDGRWYAYYGGVPYDRSGYLSRSSPDLYKVDLITGSATVAERGNQRQNRWLVDEAGVVIARSEYDQRSGRWRLFDSRRREELIDRRLPISSSALIGFGRTPGTLLIADSQDGEGVLREMPLNGGASAELFDDTGVKDFIHDPTTRLLLGAELWRDPGIKLLDPAMQRRADAVKKAFPKTRMRLVSFTAGMKDIIVFTEGPEDPGTYWLVDFDTKRAREVGFSYPTVYAQHVGPPSMFAYKAADGLAMEGVLTLPPGKTAKNLPLVVLPHGGPIAPGDQPGFNWWAQAYASRGYAVFQPNYRGTLGYGEAFSRAAVGQWGRKMQTDVSDGVAALAKAGIIDAKRVCIVGASYGGYAALASVTVQQGLYRCAVSVSGPAEMRRMISWVRGRTGSDNSAARLWRGLTFDLSGERDQDAISPAANAARADAPILLMHGKDDTVVPLEQSQLMASALKRAGKPHELVVMDGEDHWLSRETTRIAMLKSAVAFVEKHNPPS